MPGLGDVLYNAYNLVKAVKAKNLMGIVTSFAGLKSGLSNFGTRTDLSLTWGGAGGSGGGGPCFVACGGAKLPGMCIVGCPDGQSGSGASGGLIMHFEGEMAPAVEEIIVTARRWTPNWLVEWWNRARGWMATSHSVRVPNCWTNTAAGCMYSGTTNTRVSNGDLVNVATMVGPFGLPRAARGAATIDTSLVRFTQSSVSQTFRTGEKIDSVAAALRGPGGDTLAAGFKPIRMFEEGGQLFSLDNRRLLTFSMAGREVPFVWATNAERAAEAWKFTATPEQLGGWFIRVGQ